MKETTRGSVTTERSSVFIGVIYTAVVLVGLSLGLYASIQIWQGQANASRLTTTVGQDSLVAAMLEGGNATILTEKTTLSDESPAPLGNLQNRIVVLDWGSNSVDFVEQAVQSSLKSLDYRSGLSCYWKDTDNLLCQIGFSTTQVEIYREGSVTLNKVSFPAPQK